MLILGLILNAFLLATAIGFGRHRQYALIGGLQILFFFAPAMCMMAVTSVLLQTVLLAILSLVAAGTSMEPRRFIVLACGMTALAVLLSIGLAWNSFQETLDRRERLAFESIQAPRPHAELEDDESISTPAVLSPQVLSHLETQEAQVQSNYNHGQRRAGAIQRLHENTVQQFINSPGFGVTRMGGYDRYLMREDETEPVPQPTTVEPPYAPETDQPAKMADAATPPSENVLQQLHDAGVVDFVHPAGYGYRNREGLIAGFEPHRFSVLPTESPEFRQKSVDPWRLARVELVSLLKSPEPRVYESEYLPRMDELKDATTRTVRPFEANRSRTAKKWC